MLAWPASRSALIARLRSVAITRGALPTRIWQRSSSKVTSRTQCTRFSIPQCPRTRSPSCSGPARSGAKLVMNQDVSIEVASLERFARSQTTRTTWRACGKSPSGSGAVATYLVSIRPWPRSLVMCSGGKRPSREGFERVQQVRLVGLDAHEIVAVSFVHDERCVVTLRVHRVRGDHRAGQRLLSAKSGRSALISLDF